MIRLLSNLVFGGCLALFLLSEGIIGANAIAAQLTLSWTDTSSNESGFKIERGLNTTSFTQIATVNANFTSYSDTTVIGGTYYCYRVRAYNSAGNSAYTNSDCHTAPISSIGPVAAYGFNEGSGASTADASGHGYTGTLVGATWVTGKYGKALNFSGSASVQASGSALNNLASFTYCAWVYPRSQGGQKDARILHKGTISARKQLQTDGSVSNSLALYVDRASGTAKAISTANTLTLNQWQFVCGTYSETGGPRVYRNGVEVSYSTRTVGAGTTVSDSGDKLYIGNRSTADKGWDGWIDEVRIYNRVLVLSELQTLASTLIGTLTSGQSSTQALMAGGAVVDSLTGGSGVNLCGSTCPKARPGQRGVVEPSTLHLSEKIGVFRPSTGRWFLDVNGNGELDDCPIGGCLLGQPGDPLLVNVWTGESVTRFDLLDQTTGSELRNLDQADSLSVCSGANCGKTFSLPGDRTVVGDWTGTGQQRLGVFDPETGMWELDVNGNGEFDGCHVDACLGPFGRFGDLPVVGTW